MPNKLYRICNKLYRLTDSIFIAIKGLYKSPKILLLNDTSLVENWGCIATSNSLKQKIRKLHPGCVLKTRPICIVKRIKHSDFPPPINKLDEFVFNNPDRMLDYSDFQWADIIILNGEGSIHQHRVSINDFPNPLIKLLELYAAKKIFKKKVMAVNQSIGFWDDWFGEYVKSVYLQVDYLSIREPVSYRKCRSLGLVKANLCADVAFLTKAPKNLEFPKIFQKAGIKPGFVGIFLSETIKDVDIKKTLELLVDIQKRFNCQIVGFISGHVDRLHFNAISNKIKFPIFDTSLSVEDLTRALRYASVVLSGRYHCCIFSALAGCPFIPFHSNYPEKNNGLIELLGDPFKIFDYVKDPNELILNEIENIINNREKYVNSLKEGVEQALELTKNILPKS